MVAVRDKRELYPTHRSEVSILFRGRRRSVYQVFPSLAVHVGFGTEGLAVLALDLVSFVFCFTGALCQRVLTRTRAMGDGALHGRKRVLAARG